MTLFKRNPDPRIKPPVGSILNFDHPLSRGLVTCLLMNEGGGNNLYDLSGKQNHGVLTNGPLWVGGQGGSAVSFDGTNDYIKITDGFTNTVKGDDTHTVAWWSYCTDYSNNPMVFDAVGTTNPNGFACEFGTVSTKLWWGEGASYRTYTLPAHTGWNHFAIVKTGATTGNLYLNNTLQSTYTGSLSACANENSDLIIGKYRTSGYEFTGLLDNIQIWKRSLSVDEIAQLYAEPYSMILQPQYWYMVDFGAATPSTYTPKLFWYM